MMTSASSTPAMLTALKHDILIVEDREETSRRLRAAIDGSDDLAVCHVAHTVQDGLDALFETRPRLVLTDLGLPDGSGIEIVKAVIETDWTCAALVISVFGDEARVLSAIGAGARGYILKNSGTDTIADDIRAVLEGGSPISPQIARYFLTLVTDHQRVEQIQSGDIDLTQREREILAIVARGYKRAEIGKQLGISVGTVGNHIHNIYKKLKVSSNIEAVSRATKMGIL